MRRTDSRSDLARRIDSALSLVRHRGRCGRAPRLVVEHVDVAACVPEATSWDVRAWAAGRAEPTPAQLRALALACGVSPHWLASGVTAGRLLLPAQAVRQARRRLGLPARFAPARNGGRHALGAARLPDRDPAVVVAALSDASPRDADLGRD